MFWYNTLTMSIWDRLLFLIGLRPKSGPRYYELSESLQVTLSALAQHEGRPVDDFLPDLLAAGLTQYYATDKTSRQWQTLTDRERDVAALACLGMTNRQIANRLGVSLNTIKTHIRNVLAKFEVPNKSKLRQKLSGWDFSAWSHWL